LKIDLFIKGIIIGLFKIIPGLSGSLMAYNLNVYDECITKLNNLFNYDNIKYLFNIGIGILLSIIIFSKIISNIYLNYTFIFIMISILLIFKTTNFCFKNKLFFILSFVISLLILLVKFKINSNINNNYFIIILGLIESMTTIIPSISGSAIFMMLNQYENVLSFYNTISVKTFYFIVGILLGLIILIKLIKIILDKYKIIFSSIISGFSLSTIIYLLIKNIHSISELIIAIVILLLGIKISLKHIIY